MLLIILLALLLLYGGGLWYGLTGFIHVLLVAAILVLLVQILTGRRTPPL